MKFITRYLLYLPVLVWFSTIELWAEEPIQADSVTPLSIVSLDNDYPYAFTLDDGTKTGLFIEFWKLWSQASGIPVDFQLTTFEESLLAVKNGEAVHIGLFKSPERAEWAEFSLPYFRVDTGVIFGRHVIEARTLLDADGYRVAVLAGSFQARHLAEKYPTLILVPFSQLSSAFDQLQSEEVEAIVGEVPNLDAELSRRLLHGLLKIADEKLIRNNVHAVMLKGQPELLEKIDKGIEDIPVSTLTALSKKWLPTVTPFFENQVSFSALSVAEQKWLQDNSSFSLGIATNVFPFSFTDKDGITRGLVAEYVDHVEDVLKINLHAAHSSTWIEQYELFRQNKIDVMSDIVKTPKRAPTTNFTDPYYSTLNVIVARRDSFFINGLGSLTKKKVGLIDGYLVDLISMDFPEVKLEIVSTTQEGLEKLSRREIDAYVDNFPLVNYTLGALPLTNLTVAAFLPYDFELSMAVRDGLEPLVPILNKVFAGMSEKQKSAIANTWLSTQVTTGVDVKTIFLWGLPAILIALILILFYVTRSNSLLRLEVINRERAEKSAVEANNAKSKFLSSMSHELRTPLNAILGFSQLLELEGTLEKRHTEYVGEIHSAGQHLLGLINQILELTRIEMGKIELSNEPVSIGPLVEECISALMPLTEADNIEVSYSNLLADAVVNTDAARLRQCLMSVLLNAVHFNKDNGEILVEVDLSESQQLEISVRDTGVGMSAEDLEYIFEPFHRVPSSEHVRDGVGIGLTTTLNMVELMGGALDVSSEVGKGSCFTITLPLVS